MQINLKQLVPVTQLTAAAVVYYTAPALTTAEVTAATATNVTATTQTLSVSMVPSGGTVGVTNIVVQLRSVPANSSIQLWELIAQKLPPGATIQAQASAAGAINLTIGGREVIG